MRLARPAHPGQFIRMEVIEPLGLSVTDAAKVLGVTRPALSARASLARIPCSSFRYAGYGERNASTRAGSLTVNGASSHRRHRCC